VNTNQIIEVDKSVYDIIDEYEENNVDWLKSKYKKDYQISDFKRSIENIEIARREHGMFSFFRPEKVTFGIRIADDVKKLHETGLNQILLEITNQCNLNCAYCSASGKYANPGNPPGNMSWQTCRESVDFFFDRTCDSKKCFISFYGGEPLKCFDLIKDTVEYVKKKYGANEFRFNLTTNGTLLNKEIADFFIENDFSVLVSLDGPQKINDRYRRFKNGKGTFNRIMKNLEFLKAYNRDYFSRKVSITSVLAPPFETIDEILDFFSKSKTLSKIKNKIRSSLVSTRGTSFLKDFGLEEFTNEFPTIEERFIERLKKAILENNLNHLTIEKKQIYSILYSLARRPIDRLYDHVYPLGACHIGLRRVFVKTTGDFYICEKGEKDYKIGCIEDGFDFERIAYYYRKFEEVLEDCKDCWAINHCERCWASIGNLEEFTGNKKEQFCSYSKKIIEKAFKVYTQLLRENPDSLKVFKDVIIA
jgi:uncharacterized protein